MTRNPFLNALTALAYISFVAMIMFYGMRMAGPVNSVVVPIGIISLFTLSAAVMGYIFLSTPVEIYFNGHKKEAVALFLKTVLIFAIITFVTFVCIFLGIR